MYTFFFFSKSANSSYLAENDEDFDSHTSKVLNFVIEYALITKKKDLWSMSFDIDEARSFCQLNRPCTERAEYPFFGANVRGQNERGSSCLEIHFLSLPVSESDKWAVSHTLNGLRR